MISRKLRPLENIIMLLRIAILYDLAILKTGSYCKVSSIHMKDGKLFFLIYRQLDNYKYFILVLQVYIVNCNITVFTSKVRNGTQKLKKNIFCLQ